jgi:3-oxoacyl-[acyl-carrier-protein] synthase-3
MAREVVATASKVVGWGHALPETVIPNAFFENYLETSDEWIKTRTGISERRWADEFESASSLALPAAQRALQRAGLTPADVDGIIVATVTPDYQFPSTACFLQRKLECPAGLAFDVNAVCSGFIYALVTADALIRSKRAKTMLVVGVDIYSRILDKNDRRTCILFGDGAGAVVLQATSETGEHAPGLIHAELGSDGTFTDILCVPRGTAKEVSPESLSRGEHFLQMEGKEVFRLAVRRLVEISESVVRDSGFTFNDVDFVISHQANKRILDSMAKSIGINEARVLCNVDTVGNTSAASIPILLSESIEAGIVTPGSLILLSAFGGGVTWGAGLLRL